MAAPEETTDPRLAVDANATWRALMLQFAQAPVPFGVWDSDGVQLASNEALQALTRGCRSTEPLYGIENGRELLRDALAGASVRVGPARLRVQHENDDSGFKALSGDLFPLRDDQGRLTHIVGVFRDAAPEMLAQAEITRLREAEARLQAILDNAPIALVTMDREGIYTSVEGQRVRAMNLQPSELIGASALDLARDQPHAQEALRRGLTGEASTFRGASRVGGTYEAQLVPHFDADGRVSSLTAISYDFTRQEEVERALRESQETLLHALNAGRLVTFELDFRDGRAQFSDNASEILGVRAEALPNVQAAIELIHPDDQAQARHALRLAIEGTSIPDLQYRMIRPDNGETVWFERRIAFRRDQHGKVIGASGLLIDITQRKRAEEMDAHAAELKLENQRMETANRLKSEFLANMSHELRTPLNVILGFTELLHDGHVPRESPRYREFLGDILQNGQHLLRLVNDILDLAKVEAGKQDFHPQNVVLSDLVGDVCAALAPSAARKQIRLLCQVDSVGAVTIDPARFKQVLFNYLSNALKFTPNGGQVVVRTVAESGGMFRLEVEDNGIGIVASDIGRLFSEFQQLDTGLSKRHQGTGLGLLLTRRLVEAQGGSVSVRSQPGAGSTFVATLPRTPASDGTTAPAEPA